MQRTILMVAIATLAIGCSDSDTNTTNEPATTTTQQTQPATPAPEPVVEQISREELAAIKDAQSELVEYQCDDGLEFEVEFVDQGLISAINDMPLDLRQQPSGSGSLYADDTWSLHIKGDEAVLTSGDVSRECQTRSALTEAGDIDPESALTEAALNTDALNAD